MVKKYYYQVLKVIYYRKGYGIYSGTLYDENFRFIKSNFSIKGNSFEMKSEGYCYEISGKIERDEKYLTDSMNFDYIFEVNPNDFGNFSVLWTFERKEKDRYFNINTVISTEKIMQNLYERLAEEEYVKKFYFEYNIPFTNSEQIVYNEDEDLKQRVLTNPYELNDLIAYFTFSKCDKIAAKIGYEPNSQYRIKQAIRSVIRQKCKETGDTYVILDDIIINQIVKSLNYYLDKKEIESILSKNSLGSIIDYTAFNFSNSIIVNELLKYKDSEYLFFEIDKEEVLSQINISDEKTVLNFNKLYIKEFYEDEKSIKETVEALNKNVSDKNDTKNLMKQIKLYETIKGITLNSGQISAILSILEYNNGGFHILNGAAGTGKSTVVEALIFIYKTLSKNKIEVIAPTGMATNVLKENLEIVGDIYPKTIHKLLRGNLGKSSKLNSYNKLVAGFYIVDETSMLDLELAASLLNGIDTSNETKILFLGDYRQLPSIGPGKVLRDLMKLVPNSISTLSEPCRQNKNSGILENSINILKEQEIVSSKNKDNYVLWADNNDKIFKFLKQSIDYFSKKCNYSTSDCQILTAKKNGLLGTYELNKLLQEIYNPYGDKPFIIEEFNENRNAVKNNFKIGDKIMNTKNNYSLCIYNQPITARNIDFYYGMCVLNKKNEVKQINIANGDIGYIVDMFKTKIQKYDRKGHPIGLINADCIIVKFKDGYAAFDPASCEDLRLAYAISIHKSQGSGYKGCITIIDKTHEHMVSNELLYVAMTRAKEQNIFIGSKDVYLNKVSTYSSDRKTTLIEPK